MTQPVHTRRISVVGFDVNLQRIEGLRAGHDRAAHAGAGIRLRRL